MEDILLDPTIPRRMFYKIGEVSHILGVKPYVLRYWESEFKQIKPAKNRFGQRVYRPKDLVVLLRVKELLYKEKFTIAGAKKQLTTERMAHKKQIEKAGTERTRSDKGEDTKTDINIFIQLLRDHKAQLQEILSIFNSEVEMQTENKIGA